MTARRRLARRRQAVTARLLRPSPLPALRPRALEIGWLTVVWVLLWGTFSPLSIVGGVVVAIGVLAAFRFPAPSPYLPVRPVRLLALVGYLGYDMVVSGAAVSWQTLRYGPAARGAVFEVPLLTSSDRVVAAIANALSLSPGAMALQIDQERGRWFVYALGPRDRAGVERSRMRTMDMQRRVIGALGTPEELAAVEAAMAAMTTDAVARAAVNEVGVTEVGTAMGAGMGAVFVGVIAMLGVAATLTVYRLLRGPSTLDRIVALDVFVVLVVVGAGVYVAAYRDGSNIPLLAAVVLVGFVGSVSAARLAVRRERHR